VKVKLNSLGGLSIPTRTTSHMFAVYHRLAFETWDWRIVTQLIIVKWFVSELTQPRVNIFVKCCFGLSGQLVLNVKIVVLSVFLIFRVFKKVVNIISIIRMLIQERQVQENIWLCSEKNRFIVNATT
jgi:hypothetical protein